ncbi:MAG: hypothetical protein J1F17_06840 [Oscillospiraceae bacterium]|nr:hypothetical protein [Oscillospiraceae bacterium]
MDKEYGKLAVKYNTLKEELFKAAYRNSNNKALLNLIKETGLFEEYTGFCLINQRKSRIGTAIPTRQ